MLKTKRTIVVKIKKICLLDRLDNIALHVFKKTGNYPSKFELSKEDIKKMYEELKDKGISSGWADRPGNYRGIPIRIKKGVKLWQQTQ